MCSQTIKEERYTFSINLSVYRENLDGGVFVRVLTTMKHANAHRRKDGSEVLTQPGFAPRPMRMLTIRRLFIDAERYELATETYTVLTTYNARFKK
jgi:hypothetical protein